MAEILLLDAMGVLYQAADDVADLLVPFVRQHGNPDLTADDLGLGKPSPEIYRHALGTLKARPEEIVFVDDRPHNLDAARDLGVRTVLFGGGGTESGHRTIRRLTDLL